MTRSPFRAFVPPRLRTLLIGLVVVALLPLSLFAAWQLAVAREEAAAQAGSQSLQLARLAAQRIENLGVELRSIASAVGAIALDDRQLPGVVDAELKAFRATLPEYVSDLFVVNRSGRIVSATVIGPEQRKLIDLSDRDYVRVSFATGKPMVSEPIRSRVNGKWLVVFTYPVLDPGGSPEFIACVNLRLDQMPAFLGPGPLADDAHVRVFTPGGMGIWSSVAGENWIGNAVEMGSVHGATRAEHDTVRIVSILQDPPSYVAAVDAAFPKWDVVASFPVERANESARAAIVSGIVGLAISLALGVLGAIVLGRYVALRVRAVREAAGEIAAGNFASRVGVRAGEEGDLAELATGFNAMAGRLDESRSALTESELRSRRIIENCPDAIWILEFDGMLVDVNDAACRQLGYRRDEMVGKHVNDFKADHEPEMVKRHSALVLETGHARFDSRHRRKDGAVLDVDISLGRLSLEGNRAVAFIRDITFRRNAEERLRLYLRSLEAATSGVQIADARAPDFPIVYVNPAFTRITGYLPEDALGGNCRYLHGEDRDQPGLADMREALRAGRGVTAEVRNYRKDGAMFLNRLSISPVRDSAGTVTHFIGIQNDVTEQRRAEQAFLLGQERLLAATEGAHIGAYEYNLATGYCYLSPSWKNYLGYGEGELADDIDVLRGLAHPDDLAAMLAHTNAFLAAPTPNYRNEFRYRKKDGSYIWVRSIGRMVPDEQGRMVRLLGVHMDIDADRTLRQSLQEEHERLKLALSAAKQVAWEWQIPAGRINWGDTADLVLGSMTQEALTPSAIARMVHPADYPRYRETFERCLESGEDYLDEYRITWSDGSVHWVRGVGHLERDSAGKPLRMLGVSQDVTERVRAVEALRESESKYRTVLETSRDAVLMIDAGGVIEYANPATEKLLGYTPQELVGRPMAMTQAASVRATLKDWMTSYLATGERRINWNAIESLALHRDGREVPIEFSINDLEISGRKIFVAFVRDISMRKHAEREMVRINETLEQRVGQRTAELQAANNELEAFSYTVAHDLRAPLRAVDGFSQVLEEELGPKLADGPRKLLRRIRGNAQTMATMIDELLDLARISRSELAKKEVDLGPIVEGVVAQLRAIYPEAEIEVGKLPVVLVDPGLIRMALFNLVDNALKFSARSKPSRVRVTAEATPSVIKVSVSDNGVGFDQNYAGKLFGVFQRLHSREEFEGTGIGLATVARIVTRHGGKVRAQAEVGKGATFEFSLPREDANG